MATQGFQGESAKINAQAWGKPYDYLGVVEKITIYPDPESPVIHLQLKDTPKHHWVAHVPPDQHDRFRTKGIKKGTHVRINFNQHGHAMGLHKLTAIHKATVLEQLKTRLFGRL